MPVRAVWCALLLALLVSASPAAVQHHLFGLEPTSTYDVEQNGSDIAVDLEPGPVGDLRFDAPAVSTTIVIPSGQISDLVPPADVTTLAATSSTQSSVTLTWTAVGDDGMTGRASFYDARFSTAPIHAGNWGAASQADGEPAPKWAGQFESFTVTGLAPGTVYYFAIKVGDEVGNWSGLSNLVQRETQIPSGDTVPPAAVNDLAVDAVAPTSLTLVWTAVGDDGSSGQASLYDLRYSTTEITPGTWAAATQVSGEPAPKPPGQHESFAVADLLPGTRYYFALKVGDEVPNWSPLSNVPNGTTAPSGGDVIAPAQVTDLGASVIQMTSITLHWTAVGDDGVTGQASGYDVRYARSALDEANWATATQATGEPLPKAAGESESFTLEGLEPGTVYYVAMKVCDEVPNWSALSDDYGFQTKQGQDTVAPARVTTLAIQTLNTTSATLAWTAVGDDGMAGQAASYDLRYATFPIFSASWARATQVVGEPSPKASGQPEQFRVSGLTPGTRYYFALRVADEVPNTSEISNVPYGSTPETPPPDPVPPAPVTDLAAVHATENAVTLSWTAVGDDGLTGRADSYDLRYSMAPITPQNWLAASQAAGEPEPALPGQQESFSVVGLDPGTTYYFVLQVGDEALNWSGLSNLASRTTETPPPPDTIPPAEVDDLAGEGVSTERIHLTWTAVGDDGMQGRASVYDLRYSDSPIDETTWSGAARIGGLPVPQAAGQMERFDVDGLDPATLYYFALAVSDEAENWSAPSNLASAATFEEAPPDSIPPSPLSDLAAASTGQTTVTLTWTAVGDDGLEGRASQYDFRRSEAPIDETGWDDATPVLDEPLPGQSGDAETMTIQGLEPRTTYYFAARVADEAGNLSGLSNSVKAATVPLHDFDPPAAILQIEGEARGHRAVRLRWTAPADSDTIRCLRYEGRFLEGGIDAESWAAAHPIPGLPVPSRPGERDSVVVAGLEPGAAYGFAIRARDEAENLGPLGAPLIFTTTSAPDTLGPEPILDLSIAAVAARSATLRWTATADRVPEDCLEEARVESLEIRVSRNSLEGEGWDAGTIHPAPPPALAGTQQEWTLVGLDPETTYHFGIRSRDAGGLWSGPSNLPTATTTQESADSIPPGPIVGLEVVGAGIDHLDLSWIAPGDDGDLGQAERYEVRYSTEPILEADWDRAVRVQPDPACAEAGTEEWLRVEGLLPSTPYHFTLRAIDASGNLGPICPCVRGVTKTPDAVPPSPIADLAAIDADTVSCELRWSAPADDRGRCASYDLRRSTEPIDSESWERAEPIAPVPPPLDPGLTQIQRVAGLLPGTRYHFAIVAVDSSGNRSALSNVAEIKTDSSGQGPDGEDLQAPARIDDLFAVALGATTVRLTWTAVGDDGRIGRADAYEIRRSHQTIAPEDWDAAILVDVAIAPAPAGETETILVTDLAPETIHHFAVRASDEAGNRSEVSVDAVAETPPRIDTSPPAVPAGLSAEVASDRIAVAWEESPDPDVVDYRLTRWDGGAAEPSRVIEGLLTAAYVDSTILPEVEYRYAVAARDASGNLSTMCAPVARRAAIEGFLPLVLELRPVVSVDSLETGELGRVVLRWTAVPVARFARFAVDRTDDSGASWQRVCDAAQTEQAAYRFEQEIDPGRFHYRIVAVSPRGYERGYDSIPVVWGLGVERLALRGPYPNPCAGSVALELDLPQAATVGWSLYDARGRRVGGEPQRVLESGTRSILWDLSTLEEELASGIYFIRVEVGSTGIARKLVLRR